MDEERGTTVNQERIRAAQERAGLDQQRLSRPHRRRDPYLDGGGAGHPKGETRGAAWYRAYEDWSVDVGLACGLAGHAQIGKGMWAALDLMAAMLAEKGAQPGAGANTAWVPSPTAATLHATHNHEVGVRAVEPLLAGRRRALLEDILTPPVVVRPNWSAEAAESELDKTLRDPRRRGALDRSGRRLLEGAGHRRRGADGGPRGLAHLLGAHGELAAPRITSASRSWRPCADGGRGGRQNAGDPLYRPMAPDFDASVAFKAACDLVFEGTRQPNGDTEPILHARRLERNGWTRQAESRAVRIQAGAKPLRRKDGRKLPSPRCRMASARGVVLAPRGLADALGEDEVLDGELDDVASAITVPVAGEAEAFVASEHLGDLRGDEVVDGFAVEFDIAEVIGSPASTSRASDASIR